MGRVAEHEVFWPTEKVTIKAFVNEVATTIGTEHTVTIFPGSQVKYVGNKRHPRGWTAILHVTRSDGEDVEIMDNHTMKKKWKFYLSTRLSGWYSLREVLLKQKKQGA